MRKIFAQISDHPFVHSFVRSFVNSFVLLIFIPDLHPSVCFAWCKLNDKMVTKNILLRRKKKTEIFYTLT